MRLKWGVHEVVYFDEKHAVFLARTRGRILPMHVLSQKQLHAIQTESFCSVHLFVYFIVHHMNMFRTFVGGNNEIDLKANQGL